MLRLISGGVAGSPTLRAPLAPLTVVLIAAFGALTLVLVQASPAPDMTAPQPQQARAVVPVAPVAGASTPVLPQPAQTTAEPTTDADADAPAGERHPATTISLSAEAAEAIRAALSAALSPVASEETPAVRANPIEGVDNVELLLHIAGALTTHGEPQPTEPQALALAATQKPGTSPIAPGALFRPPAIPTRASVFDSAQVVSFYGYPGVGVMGELGLHSPSGAAAAISRLAAEYDALNGTREVLPALHLIVAVAQRHPGYDGLYLQRMEDDLLREYVEAAREAGILLFVDVQIGWSDALTEVMLLEDVLREPFVHLALDPEFATRSFGTAPGISIGTIGAADVNGVQHYLASLVREHDLPPKVLVLHQFLQGMLTGVDYYHDVPEVDVTIDMDGFGSPYVKLTKYDMYARADYAERAAIKLFYHWDAPLITPATLMGLEHPPDLVIYQ